MRLDFTKEARPFGRVPGAGNKSVGPTCYLPSYRKSLGPVWKARDLHKTQTPATLFYLGWVCNYLFVSASQWGWGKLLQDATLGTLSHSWPELPAEWLGAGLGGYPTQQTIAAEASMMGVKGRSQQHKKWLSMSEKEPPPTDKVRKCTHTTSTHSNGTQFPLTDWKTSPDSWAWPRRGLNSRVFHSTNNHSKMLTGHLIFTSNHETSSKGKHSLWSEISPLSNCVEDLPSQESSLGTLSLPGSLLQNGKLCTDSHAPAWRLTMGVNVLKALRSSAISKLVEFPLT